MDYITTWISEIILLILLAVVLELLLPNSNLQRYVRLVVGLLLLLALLKPVLAIFDTDVDSIFSQVSTSSVVGEEQIKNSIESQKNEIQDANRAYIEEQMAVQYKEQVAKEVAEQFQMNVTDVHLTLDQHQPGSDVSVQHIVVTLAPDTKQKQGDIEPVEEVTIGVSEPSNERTEGGGEEDKKKDIRHFLAEQWSLPSEKITIRMEGGDVSDNE